MPFRSKAQQKFMFWKMPETARRWAHETPSIKRLPERIGKKRKKKLTIARAFAERKR